MKFAKKMFLVQAFTFRSSYCMLVRNYQRSLLNIHNGRNFNINEKIDANKKAGNKFEIDKSKNESNEDAMREIEGKPENSLFKLIEPPSIIENGPHKTDHEIICNVETNGSGTMPPPPAFGFFDGGRRFR